MTSPITSKKIPNALQRADRQKHYLELLRQTLTRQLILYFLPLLLLAIFFNLQYKRFIADSRRSHLGVIAEQQAATLDLFLRERLVNLANLVDDPEFLTRCCDEAFMRSSLKRLQQTNNTFVDLAVVNDNGHIEAYQGNVQFPSSVTYEDEGWFTNLMRDQRQWIITDIYLGFRGQPHFTIAVKRIRPEGIQIVRSALSPEKITEYLTTLEGAQEVHAAVVNQAGVYQVVTTWSGAPLSQSHFVPPQEPSHGYLDRKTSTADRPYAYARLQGTPWVLVVMESSQKDFGGAFAGVPGRIFWITALFVALMLGVILFRARQLVGKQMALERHEADLSGQLVQAAKLASVGELAAGIAHEINNPLAIIAEEVGLLKDMMDPELAAAGEPLDLEDHLNAIHQAVFRCRDITRKLLTFVRHTEVKLDRHHIHKILDEVLDGMLANELTISNIQIDKRYDDDITDFLTDRNQLIQVFVNLVKNAIDAMPGGGRLTVKTFHRGNEFAVSIEDTGCGMTMEQREKLFMPFFTTKPPGKGTGLGLSVSLSIIKNFGGRMRVDSAPGQGSTFAIELPYENK